MHEAAHGYAAWALGDDTAKVAGRLSLNPLVHVDRVGTILLPGALLIFQLITIGRVEFMFGWAKPVPVSAWRFRDPRRGMALVAAAGPLMNFFLAWLGALRFTACRAADTTRGPAVSFIQLFMLVNLGLGLFNLIPIPPLDGGRIAVGILPAAAGRRLGADGARRAGHRAADRVPAACLLREFGIQFDPGARSFCGTLIPSADATSCCRLAGHDVDG